MQGIEKRKHIRIDSLNLSHVSVKENGDTLKQGMGRTLNISESGILLEIYFPMELHQKVLLTVALQEDIIELNAKVVHSRTGEQGMQEVGIQFQEMSEEQRKRVNEFVRLWLEQHPDAG